MDCIEKGINFFKAIKMNKADGLCFVNGLYK